MAWLTDVRDRFAAMDRLDHDDEIDRRVMVETIDELEAIVASITFGE